MSARGLDQGRTTQVGRVVESRCFESKENLEQSTQILHIRLIALPQGKYLV